LRQPVSKTILAYLLSVTGLIGVVVLVALDRIMGVQLTGFMFLFWLAFAIIPAVGIALLFHIAAVERDDPPASTDR